VALHISETEFNNQVIRTVQDYLRKQNPGIGGTGLRPPGEMMWQWGIANTVIANASNGLTSPGSGEVEVLRMDENKKLERSGVKHTGKNRSESVSIAANTLVAIARLKGEWVIMWSDCAALANPPA